MAHSSSSAAEASVSTGTSPYAENDITGFERKMNFLLGALFLVTAIVAARRMFVSLQQTSATSAGGAETAVVTAFYSLILLTSTLRATWFLVPEDIWQPSYTPIAVKAFDSEHPAWVGAALSELVITLGSLALFSIFILILVYWADILKKYFQPGMPRSVPMVTFLQLVAILAVLLGLNAILFLMGVYSTEGMILFHAVLLAVVSMICVAEMTLFSHKFRTVLKTLGAINQVPTEPQIRRIVWITVTGNIFFITRALLETTFSVTVIMYWVEHRTVARVFSHLYWEIYTGLKYFSEVTILALMLWILTSRFDHGTTSSSSNSETRVQASNDNKGNYTPVPNANIVV